MYKRGGHKQGAISQRGAVSQRGALHMHGAVSQSRPVHSASSSPSLSSSPSPCSSPSLASSPSLSSNPPPLHADGQHGHIGPSFDAQEHNRGETRPPMQTESTSIPHSSVQQSNDERTIGDEDNRFMISPYGDSFMDATFVVRQLNKSINKCWRGHWTSYTNADKELKDLWWNEFKRKFRWDEMEDDEVRRVFKKKAGDHIRNVMNRAKTRNAKPEFITGDDWIEIKRTWDIDKNKERSERNKKNRASTSSEGSAVYAGGSINIGEHRKRLANELGTEPTYVATFERTFQKKDKTWTGDRARAIKEKYDELLMSAASGGDGVDGSEPSVDNMELWVEASGGMKRGKIFGMGSLSRVYKTKVATASSSNAAVSRRRQLDEQVTQELSDLKQLLVEKDEQMSVMKQQYEDEIKSVNERCTSLASQMQVVLQHLNLNRDQVLPVRPTNLIGDGQINEPHNDNEVAADDDFVNRFID